MNSTLSINTVVPPRDSLRPSSAIRILRSRRFFISQKTLPKNIATVRAAASSGHNASHIKSAACAAIIAVAAFGKFSHLSARAEIPTTSETLIDTQQQEEEEGEGDEENSPNSPLTRLLGSKSEAVGALKSLLQEKLESGEDEEALSILKKLSSAQPDDLQWKFLIARVSNELGKISEARDAFEEILARNPLSFEALFENALVMDRAGERETVMNRLEEALRFAQDAKKSKEARDVKLIMAQMQFLHKNIDEALSSYDELVKEDPSDFRPYFCKGMIFSLMDKNVEARAQFAKYKELSPKKFEVEGYLRTPLSKMKLFGTEEGN